MNIHEKAPEDLDEATFWTTRPRKTTKMPASLVQPSSTLKTHLHMAAVQRIMVSRNTPNEDMSFLPMATNTRMLLAVKINAGRASHLASEKDSSAGISGFPSVF